jgi:4-amino-4-deoxy-L-arabinose transferase-like glycosyltransferase
MPFLPDLSFTQRMLVLGMLLLTAVRMVIAANLGLTPDEAFLAEWARHPGIASMEGGWTPALLTIPGSSLLGPTPLGIRWLMPLTAAATTWVLYQLVRRATGDKQAAWAACLLNLTPAFNHAAIFLRPELPAVFLQLCGMAALWKALHRASSWDWHWALAGILFGLAFYSWPGTFWSLIATATLLAGARRWRRHIFRPGFWILLADAALFAWPIWHWNQQHAMAGFHRWHELIRPSQTTNWLGPFFLIAKWSLALTPLIFAATVWAIYRGLQRWNSSDAGRFFAAFSLVPFAGALAASLGGGHATNWIAPALPALCALTAWAWDDISPQNIARRQRLQWLSVLPAFILTPIAIEPDILRLAGLTIPPSREPSRSWRAWQTTTSEASRIIAAALPQAELDSRGSRRLFLIADSPDLASILSLHLPRDLPVRRPTPSHPLVHPIAAPIPESSYHFWPRYDSITSGRSFFAGCTALFFTESTQSEPPPEISRAFTSWRTLAVFDTNASQLPIRRTTVFACYGYTGIPE